MFGIGSLRARRAHRQPPAHDKVPHSRRTTRRVGLVAAAAVVALGATAGVFAASAPSGLPAARFVMEIDGVQIATFDKLVKMTLAVEAHQYFATADGDVALKLIGRGSPPTVTLSGPLTSDSQLWAWHDAVRAGLWSEARKTVTLVVHDAQGAVTARFVFQSAMPSEIAVTTATSKDVTTMVQTVTFTSEWAQRVAP